MRRSLPRSDVMQVIDSKIVLLKKKLATEIRASAKKDEAKDSEEEPDDSGPKADTRTTGRSKGRNRMERKDQKSAKLSYEAEFY